MELLGFSRVIRERMWLVLLTTSACLLVVIIYQLMPPSSYQAEGSLHVQVGATQVLGLEADKVKLANSQSFWDTLMQVGQSRELVQEAAASVGITGPDIVKRLSNFELERPMPSDVVIFRATGDRSDQALTLASAGMKALIEHWRALRVAAAQEADKILKEHLAKAEVGLSKAEEELSKSQGPNLPGTPQEQLLALQNELVVVQSQLTQAEVEASTADDRAIAIRQLAQQEGSKPVGERGAAVGTETAALQTQKTALAMQLALMLQRRKPDHPDVKDLQVQINEVDRLLKQQPKPSAFGGLPEPFQPQAVSAQLDARAARGKIAAYGARLRELQGMMAALAERAKSYQETAQRADQARAYRDGLRTEIRTAEAEVARLNNVSDIVILDKPQLLPSPKTIKRFLLFLLGAAVMGAFLGCFVVLLMRYVDITVRDELDVAQMLGKSVLAIIPRFEEVAQTTEEPAPPDSPEEEQQDERS